MNDNNTKTKDDKTKIDIEVIDVKEQIFYKDKPIEEVIENITGRSSSTTTSSNSYFPSGW